LLEGQIGRFGAFEDAADIDANLAEHICNAGPVTHQQAIPHGVPGKIAGGYPVAHRQRGHLEVSAGKETIGRDEQRFCARIGECSKRSIDFSCRARFKKEQLQTKTGSRVVKGSCGRLCRYGIGVIDKHGQTRCLGQQLMHKAEPFGVDLTCEKIDPGRVGAGMR
jgi:hypothetical protein